MADPDQILRDDAAWAATFRNTPRALATQKRYDEAEVDARRLQLAGDEMRFERRLESNPGARALFLGRERIRQGDERLEQGERRMDQQQANFAVQQERLRNNDLFRQDLDKAKQGIAEAKALLDRSNALRIAEQTRDSIQRMQALYSGPARRGSPEFAKSAIGILADNPDVDRSLRSALLGDAKLDEEDASLDTFIASLPADAGERKDIINRTTFRMGANGKLSASVAPPKSAPTGTVDEQLDTLRREYNDAFSRRAAMEDDKGKLKPGYSEDDRLFYDDEKRRIMGRIRGLAPSASGPSSPATPAPTATRPIFRDAKGNRAYKNPDGSFEPIP